MHDIAEQLGFLDPVYVQYGRFLRQLVLGADFSTGPTTVHCPAPCLGYSFLTQNPVLPEHPRPAAGDALAGRRRRGALADQRRRGRRAVGAAPRHRVRPRRDERRAGRRVAADLLHRPARRCRSSATSWGSPRRAAATRRSTTTRCCGPTTCCCRGSRLAFLYSAAYARLTRAGMLETMGEDYIRTARAKGLPERTRGRQARAAGRADPDRHALRPGPRPAARRRDHHREHVLAARASASTPSTP